ncbi:MAG: hypothetical protein KAU29_03610 [Gammaproteobacteria bacterium]|nr:hypothetical protein [Gammaproteobacteria bacterium]
MGSDKELWNSLNEILQVHLNPVDRSGIGKLNRLASGFTEINEIGYELNPENSTIELLKGLSLSSLGEHRLDHNKRGPRAEGSPLIMISWQNVNYIIDGNHRINTWVYNNYSGTFSAIKITPHK